MEQVENPDVNNPSRPRVPALRVVHLAGGLRAVDLNGNKVRIEIAPTYRLGSFPTPPYPELYRILQQAGFRPIGVDFITNHALSEGAPPDWAAFRVAQGVYAVDSERAWDRVRHAASKSGNRTLEALSSKIRTYLRLLPMRLRELSEAYNLCLHRAVSKPADVKIGCLFANEWTVHIDAAVHAFLADAGAFRDVLSETIWRIVLKNEDDKVTRIKSLINNTKDESHPLLISVQQASKDGWIYQLGEVRNHVVHVAPVANSQEHHMCELRPLRGPKKEDIPSLHLALLNSEGLVRKPTNAFVDYSDEKAVIASLDAYHEFVKTGRDALDVCEEFCFKLVELSHQVRQAGRLEERELIISADDMIGSPVFY